MTDYRDAAYVSVRVRLYVHTVRLAEIDRICRRKTRPHEAHAVEADIHGAPEQEALLGQPQANRPRRRVPRTAPAFRYPSGPFRPWRGRRLVGRRLIKVGHLVLVVIASLQLRASDTSPRGRCNRRRRRR